MPSAPSWGASDAPMPSAPSWGASRGAPPAPTRPRNLCLDDGREGGGPARSYGAASCSLLRYLDVSSSRSWRGLLPELAPTRVEELFIAECGRSFLFIPAKAC